MTAVSVPAAAPGAAPAKPRSRAKIAIEAAVALVVIVGIFGFAIPKIANYNEVFKTLKELDGVDFVLIIAATLFNLITYWWVNMAALPGLRFWPAAVVTMTPNAVASTMPAGGPLSLGLTYAILRSWGFGGDQMVLMVGVGGIWNVMGKFVLPVIAAVLLVVAGEASATLVMVALIGVAILAIALGLLALILWKESLARRIGDWAGRVASMVLKPLHKSPVATLGQRAVDFRAQTISVAQTRWPFLTAAAVANQVSAFLILLISLRGVGVTSAQMHWTEAFAAFAFARVISSIPITPGGAGIAEMSFIGALVGAGGPRPEVVAAVLLFRALTWMAPVPFGAITYVVWRHKKSWLKQGGEVAA